MTFNLDIRLDGSIQVKSEGQRWKWQNCSFSGYECNVTRFWSLSLC